VTDGVVDDLALVGAVVEAMAVAPESMVE